jgi:hypothetical protein
MSLSRRTVIISALATAATGIVRATAFGDETPATILRLQRRSIEVNGKSASVYAIRQPNRTAGITHASVTGFACGSKIRSMPRA